MGFLGGMAAGFKGIAGGEIAQVTQAIEEGRLKAFDRMIAEAKQHGATGVASVTSELKDFAGNTEFLFVGSCLDGKGLNDSHAGNFFGNAQELYCHMDAGSQPVQQAFGNISYMIGVGGGMLGSLKAMARGEINRHCSKEEWGVSW